MVMVLVAPSCVIGAARTIVLCTFPGRLRGRICRVGEAGKGVWGKPGTGPWFFGAGGVPGFPQCVSGLVPPVVCLLVE
jgi:hypothetical protein